MVTKVREFEIEPGVSPELLDRAKFLENITAKGTGCLFRSDVRKITEEKGDRRLRFVTSDETVDSYGDIIRVKGWDLEHYRKNPMFLWMHQNYALPIGRSVLEKKNAKERTFEQVFEFFGPGVGELEGEHAAFSDTVFKLYKGWKDKKTGRTVRGLNATSVGFLPKPGGVRVPQSDEEREELGLGKWGVVFEDQWLKETSGVTVPANPNAIITNAYGTLIAEDVLTDDDLEVLEAFGLRRDWILAIRKQIRAKTFVPSSDLAAFMDRRPGEPIREATETPLMDAIADRVSDRLEAEGLDVGDLGASKGQEETPEPKALARGDLRRIVDQAIIALTTIAETLDLEDGEGGSEDGDDPSDPAEEAGLAETIRATSAQVEKIAGELSEIKESIRSPRTPVGASNEEDHLDFILAAEET